MIKYSSVLILSVLSVFAIISCGTSTGSRYSQEEGSGLVKVKESKKPEKYKEDFDIKPYRTKIDVKANKKMNSSKDLNAWYGYSSSPDTGATLKSVVKTVPGYRVQILSTDNLDEADSVRAEIYFKTNQKAVYIIFDPPFYRVEVGDFTGLSDAKNLSFKFQQMGYADARVVNAQVNIFQ